MGLLDGTVIHVHTIAPDARDFLSNLVGPVVTGFARMETHMTALDDALAGIADAMTAFRADLDRELADFAAMLANAGTLTADQSAKLDSIRAMVSDAQSAVDAADPAPAAPAEAALESAPTEPTA